MRTAILAAVALALCGCHAVYTREPVGQRPRDLSGETEEWSGTWCHGEGAMAVTVSDPSNGVLRVAWLEDEQGDMEAKTASVCLRESGDWTFATIRVEEEKEAAAPGKDEAAAGKDEAEADPARLLWGRIERKKRVVLVWFPNVSKFKRLVEEKKLPGVTEKGDVILGTLGTNHLALIASEAEGVLFEWEEPLVLWKTSE